MKKIIKFIKKNRYLFWILLVIVTVIYTYYLRPLTDDELYNYGFALNITKGNLPYRDYNMIVTPLFTYLTAVILKLFGNYLLVYHFLIAVLVVLTTKIASLKLGKKSVIIYLLILIYPYNGYNIFCLLLFFIILVNKDKLSEIKKALLICAIILSKQTLGLLIIPHLIYTKRKKQVFLTYLTVGLFFLLYLLLTNSLWQCLDYCIFGMFDFTSKNNTGINYLLIIELVIIVILFILSIKSKDCDYLYILCFQIITFPIVNYYHFVFSFTPVMYKILKKTDKVPYSFLLITTTVISFSIVFNIMFYVMNNNYQLLEHFRKDTFMKGRLTDRLTPIYLENINSYLEKYPNYKVYTFGVFSYTINLNLNLPIDKYDLINDGNMGYHGSSKYIKEINNYCQKNKCMFIIRDDELVDRDTIQTNKDILKYVINNYQKIYGSNIFSVYRN